MSQIWHMVRPLIEGAVISRMLSWSSWEGDKPVESTPKRDKTEKREQPPERAVLKMAKSNEENPCRRFVCGTCESEIGSDSNLFFMLDSVYCSQQCRIAKVSYADDTSERLRSCWNLAPSKTTASQKLMEPPGDIFSNGKKRERSERAGNAFAILVAFR